MWRLVWLCVASLCSTALAVCTLPSDFWCDDETVMRMCTGNTYYCESYKANRAHKPLELTLAFETSCPDSQKFAMERLYGFLGNNSEFEGQVHFRAHPWGLAKRLPNGGVACHHGDVECQGNRVLSCALRHTQDHRQRTALLICFMKNAALYRNQFPERAVEQCAAQAGVSSNEVLWAKHCVQSLEVENLQRVDEAVTQELFDNAVTRFVPYLAVNGRGALHMQASQMMLREKTRAWAHTLKTMKGRRASTPCEVPPEFWCSSRTLINECYNSAQCTQYMSGIYGRPIPVHVEYDWLNYKTRNFIVYYLKKELLNPSNRHKVQLTLRPTPPNDLQTCKFPYTACAEYAVQMCVLSEARGQQDATSQLLCLLEEKAISGLPMLSLWEDRCHREQTSFDPSLRNRVKECVDSEGWRRVHAARRPLTPHAPSLDPWIAIDGVSLNTMQYYRLSLHRQICLWYRGPGHDRDACARCDYEPSHCW